MKAKNSITAIIGFAFAILSFNACSPKTEKTQVLNLKLASEATLTVSVNWVNENHLEIINGEERIQVKDVQHRGDSIFFTMPVFGTEFKGVKRGKGYEGQWHNYLKGPEYIIPFSIEADQRKSFPTDKDVSGRYLCEFKDNEGNKTPAIATLKQEGDRLTGTFQTETGDYRFLSGFVRDNRIELSTFDGSHAFWFAAIVKDDGSLLGLFRSGNHWLESWRAQRDDSTELRNMKSLTFLKEGYTRLNFSMVDRTGKTISLDDSLYNKKAVIVQIMGTWCPNCMDETRFLVEMYKKYHDKGLEIIALDFEPDTSMDYFVKRTEQFCSALDVTYPVLKAGISKKEEAQKSLPMLNRIISYPTAIFIDTTGSIAEIHTGFNGPGTGKAYDDYTTETEKLIQSLLGNNTED